MDAMRTVVVFSCLAISALASIGCDRPPQELPVIVSADDGGALSWRDPHGELRGEVPWVVRTDIMGPDTFLFVETTDGDVRANDVTFQVLAAGVTEYEVTLVSDLQGTVSWSVVSPDGKKLKLFTCSPRPADDARRECLRGGIPKPLLGDLVGSISAGLTTGERTDDVRAVRFERGSPTTESAPARSDP
ncbi:MAG: hypothetical protein MUC56_17000 [Thermoanaerobaculales bacterium]|nr:hypothetical protein [Thermoanaerobaculales bacterium]